MIERSEYEPFGDALAPSVPEDGVGFTGHLLDTATGLNYMQQRYYDPSVRRFLSIDPVTANSGNGANFNRYWYANNNPYRFTDPDGRLGREQRPQDLKMYAPDSLLGIFGGNFNTKPPCIEAPEVCFRKEGSNSSDSGSGSAPKQQLGNQDWFANVDPMGNPAGGNELGGVGITKGVVGFFALASGAAAYETAGAAAVAIRASVPTVLASGKQFLNNISVDGTSAGAWHANGRILGMRWKESQWGIRLDLHPMKGDPTNTPVLHINAGPLGRGEASHIPLFNPRWFRRGDE